MSLHIREEWVKNSKFHPHSNREVIDEVFARAKKILESKKLPVVIFDLDSTLFDVSRRSFEILREWLTHPETASFISTIESLKSVELKDVQYSLQDIWEIKNIPVETEPHSKHFRLAKDFWSARFFGNNYLHFDEPTPGAVRFVKNLHEMGVKIVYLTGRDVPQMAFGTFDQLKAHGLPIEVDRTRLILKPKRAMKDVEFKSNVAKLAMEWGEVVANFENEPKNLVAMAEVLKPETMNVFIHTVSSDHAAPIGQGLYRITHFE